MAGLQPMEDQQGASGVFQIQGGEGVRSS